jgi:sugar phosphate isomerase/epimerase
MQITWSLFPKVYPHFGAEELTALVREVGLDTTNVIIREGYPVQPASLGADLPPFVKSLRAAGLPVHFATTGFSAAEIIANPDLIAILGDNGLTEFRLDHFRLNGPDVRGTLQQARRQLETLAPLCERAGTRAVYQVHQNTLISSASAVWPLVDGLPAQWVGVELDPGNQTLEGYEAWNYAVPLLGKHLIAAAIKDTSLAQNPAFLEDADKGWRREWRPIDEGVVNWQDFMRALAQGRFQGTFVFMPFYHADQPEKVAKILKREVAYLRGIVNEIAQVLTNIA